MTTGDSSSMPTPRHLFLSVVRRGAAAQIEGEPEGDRARVAVHFHFDQVVEASSRTAAPGTTTTAHDETVQIPLLGPEDVLGLDARAICRVWPRPDVMDAESNLFPLVEFSDADLPWRYTPRAPTPAASPDAGQLMPWLTLIVLAEGEFEVLPSVGDRSITVLTPHVSDADLRFPAPSQLWAWAHAHISPSQVSAADQPAATIESAERALATSPERAVGRILAARRLRPRTVYTAFLVPTFERGRRAALGLPTTGVGALVPAWDFAPDGRVRAPLVGTPPEGTPPTSEPFRLPVYFQWRFGTGDEGDFEALAARLRPRPLPPEVGRRAMDVGQPAPGVPAATAPTPEGTATPVLVEAALRPWVKPVDEPWSIPWSQIGSRAFHDDLRSLTTSSLDDPRLTPPLYGEWHAPKHGLVERFDDVSRSGWFDELNADPRTRVAAGMGTVVVQKLQQELMASAWEQVEGIRRINEEMRFNQLARQASITIYRRDITTAGIDPFFRLTAPALSNILDGEVTVRESIARSPIRSGVLEGTWRRLSRARSPSRRRARSAGAVVTGSFLDLLNRGRIAAARPPVNPADLATPLSMMAALGASNAEIEAMRRAMEPLAWKSSFVGMMLVAASGLARRGGSSWIGPSWGQLLDGVADGVAPNDPRLLSGAIAEGPPAPDFEVIPAPRFTADALAPSDKKPPQRRGGADNDAARAVRRAFGDLARRLGEVPPVEPTRQALDLPALRELVLKALDPEQTFADAIRARLRLAPGLPRNVEDPLDPILAAPEFPQPMVEPLRDQSQEWILPGLDKVPQDTALLMLTNRRFVEAYMVGLCHEMGRELLWNEYPTDQRGTYFRQFWRARRRIEGEPAMDTRDITPIDGWRSTSLGAHGTRADSLVLLLRSELLRRYPTAMVYATRTASGGTIEEHFPLFVGTLSPDVTYVGFEMTRDLIESEAGVWAFVIQEQPTEPRFGIRAESASASTSYLDIEADAVLLRQANEDLTRPAGEGRVDTSSTAARWLYRHPSRVLIPADVLLRQMNEAAS